MSIRAQIMNDVKTAMKEKNQLKLDSLRFLQSAIKYREIELRPNEITDDDIIGVLKKLTKQRRESIEQFQQAGRADLVDKESQELKFIEAYLPAQMGREELEKFVLAAIAKTGAKTAKEMGLVMKEVLAQTGGRADNKMVSEIVKSKLT